MYSRRSYKRKRSSRWKNKSYKKRRVVALPVPESKFFDRAFALTMTVGASGVMKSLDGIAQGLTPINRVGMKIQVKSVELHFNFVVSQLVGTVNSVILRQILFVDTQCNGAVVDDQDLLSAESDVNALLNPQHRHRFRILMDRKTILNAPSISWDGAAEVSQQFQHKVDFKKSCSVPIYYEGTTGALTEITQNNIVLFSFVDSATPVCVMNGSSRLRFYDL